MSASVARSRVFSAYRRLFRARKNLFTGDVEAMRESRTTIKSEFVKNKAATTDGDHFEGLLTMAYEAEDMLVHGIVRGNLNSRTGHYEVKLQPEHVEGAERPMVEPVTPAVVDRLENPGKVEISKCSSSKNE